MTQSLDTLLTEFQNSKFIICNRSKGMIAPTTMKIVDFETALSSMNVRISSYKNMFSWFRTSIYQILSDGTTKNVHRTIRQMFQAGLLETAKVKEQLPYMTNQSCFKIAKNVPINLGNKIED